MGMGTYYLTSTVFLLIYLGISWILVRALHLTGTAEMAARSVLMALGFGAYGMFLWYMSDRKRRKEAAASGASTAAAPPSVDREIDDLFHQARKQFAASELGKTTQITNLATVFFLGESDAAKTSVFVHSGTEPDLLAGHVFQDDLIVSTRPANLWLADRSVFVEAGGSLLSDQNQWSRLIKRFQASRWRSLFTRTKPARAAVVCVSVENLLGGADGALSVARNLNARLSDVSHGLGVKLPVYVLFTKLDRLSFFSEFAGVLTDAEVNQVLGHTVSLAEVAQRGVYAEEQSRVLTAGFDQLFQSLAQLRPMYLNRENQQENLAGVYEFAREFHKLRNVLVRFLVDLGRPSQLRTQPVIRGFYFSGVRPVVLEESAFGARPARAATHASDPEATRMFNPDAGLMPDARATESVSKNRRVPQWLFLGRLFKELIPSDNESLAGGADVGSQRLRTTLLGAGIVCALVLATLWTVSWVGNRRLEAGALQAARAIASTEKGGAAQELPSLDSLERLETLRQSAALLSRYRQQGAPLHLRWGLYVGNAIYPSVRQVYFNRFRQLLFGASQASLLDTLRKLPQRPGPNDAYKPPYDSLKGYLMTTSFPDKSVRSFLSPLLLERWSAGRPVDAQRRALAQRQFDFYADELLLGNPFSRANEGETVEHSRFYLSQFNAAERIYQFILAEASKEKPSVNFNRQFSGSATYLVNSRDIAGAFSADGYVFVQDAIRHIKRFFGGEKWVLGDQAYAGLDPEKLTPELSARYEKEFLGDWRAYLAASQVVRYTSVADAVQKLGQLSGNQSYLLAMFCLATVNTVSASSEAVRTSFQPVHYLEPKGCPDKYVQPGNTAYLSALVSLQTALDRVAKSNPPDDTLVQQTLTEATNAYRVTRQVAQNFQIDKSGDIPQVTQKLMEDPIRYAEAIVRGLGPVQLNSEGRHFCEGFSDLSRKYPFNTESKVDATLSDVDSFFKPGDGRLYTFIEQSLKNYVEKRGSQFYRRADSHVQITDAFLRFLNRAVLFSDALYKTGGTSARIPYSMRALPATPLQPVKLTLDGQTLQSPRQGGGSKDFVWQGSGDHGANLSANLGSGDFEFITKTGLWAAFRFFGDADSFEQTGATYKLKWVPRNGKADQPIRTAGQTVELPFTLDLKGAPPVFQKGYLAGMRCVSEVAR